MFHAIGVIYLFLLCRWSFKNSADAICKQEYADSLQKASIQDLGVVLMGAGYEVGFFSLNSFVFVFS